MLNLFYCKHSTPFAFLSLQMSPVCCALFSEKGAIKSGKNSGRKNEEKRRTAQIGARVVYSIKKGKSKDKRSWHRSNFNALQTNRNDSTCDSYRY